MILKTVKSVLMDNTFSTRRPSKTVLTTVSHVVQELTLLLVQLPAPFAPKGRICHLRRVHHKNPSKNVKYVQQEPMRTHLKTKKHAKIALLGRISSTKVQMKPFMMMKAIARNVPPAKLAYIVGKQWIVFVKPVSPVNLLKITVKTNASSARVGNTKNFPEKLNAIHAPAIM